MPFELKKEPDRLKGNILKGLLENAALQYLDDVIIYSVSFEHLVK